MNSNKLMKKLNVQDLLLGFIFVLSLVLLWKTVNKSESFNTNESDIVDSQRAFDYMVFKHKFVSPPDVVMPYESVCTPKIQCK